MTDGTSSFFKYRGFQLLPGNFELTYLAVFTPLICQGGGVGPFDDIEITLVGSSKLFLSGEVKTARNISLDPFSSLISYDLNDLVNVNRCF